ncbi:MAG TPA: adenylyl-sulfate kinase [Opitutaceae bacterium]|nr:adenylyl-sulfate kinase [Opitutaceae bacterium]
MISHPIPGASSVLTSFHVREKLLGHRCAIIWMTGLSGAGKSTLAEGLQRRLLDRRVLATIIDGDALRKGLSKGLGFSAQDRRENIRRASEVALQLAQAGAVVIVALISPFRDDRALAAQRAKEEGVGFAEVFVNAPLAECERRDPKHLYRRARSGRLPSFTGIDSPYEPPLAPALEVRTDLQSIEASLRDLVRLSEWLTSSTPAKSPNTGEAARVENQASRTT